MYVFFTLHPSIKGVFGRIFFGGGNMRFSRGRRLFAISTNQCFSLRRSALLLTSALSSVLGGTWAHGQTVDTVAPPVQYVLDKNGVNLTTGSQWLVTNEVNIGSDTNGLSFMMDRSSNGGGHNYDLAIYGITGGVSASIFTPNGRKSYTFSLSGSSYTSTDGSGSRLVFTGTSYVLTLTDGTIYTYGQAYKSVQNSTPSYYISQINAPNGRQTNILWRSNTYCSNNLDGCSGGHYVTVQRIQSVTNNYGYQLWFHYGRDADIVINGASVLSWQNIKSVVAINNAVERCDSTGYTCSPVNSWPTVSYSTGTNSAISTDATGHATTYTTASNSTGTYFSVQTPAATSPNLTVQYNSAGLVSSVTKNGSTWNYSFTANTSAATMTAVVNNPDGTHRTVVSSTTVGLPTSVVNELSNPITYAYNTNGTLASTTLPEGDQVQYQYNLVGAVTQITKIPKNPNTQNSISTTAGYPFSCSALTICHQPYWTKDALGNETDYTYDATTGLVTSVTGPAAPNGIRPQTRYTYTPMQAYYLNSTGSIAASGQNTYLLTAISTCRTQAGATVSGTAGVGPFTLTGSAACTGTADEIKTTINYGPQAAGTANNLYQLSQTVAAGNGSVSSTSSQTYDNIGNVATKVGPLGSGQTSVYYYDADRRQIGVVNPDPDGSGARTPSAVKYTYNADGIATLVQVGTVPNQTSASFTNSFSEAYHASITLDAYDRPVRQITASGSTTYAAADQLYDSMGRPYCSIQYMNLAAIPGTVATSCTPSQTTGAYGPDRIAQNSYDAVGNVLTTSDNVGTLASFTYSKNGNKLTALDGKNNLTTFQYDGFDRLSLIQYPVATQGANSSDSNNYETFGYDANSNILTKRLRDGGTITATYDNLGRTSSIARSDGPTVSYTYDLSGRPLTLTRSNDGSALSYVYDGLGRLTSETQPSGAMNYQYDNAGDVTRLAWADGFYVNYVYDTIGNVTAVQENGATSGVGLLASYTYDNLGRRASVTFGNGTSRNYAYDSVSRLAGLQIAFPNATNNEVIGAVNGVGTAISYTPSSQIASVTRSNDSYAWTGAYNVTRAYTTNGLNQYTSSGGVTNTYDGRGNLNASGSTTYNYNLLNQLINAPAQSVSAVYDDAGRLSQYAAASGTTSFGYAGNALTTEFSGTTITQRYVPGPGTDEPIVWYVGNTNTQRRFLQADERGSVIAITDSSGNMINVNSYDEFGIPASTNVGRFQYTGQTWFSELGLYNYKARWYSPTLGRFMQTDPLGYGDGLNWYNYAHSDPVNGSDPTGLECVWDDGSYDSFDDPYSGSSGSCVGLGGTWYGHDQFTGAPDWSSGGDLLKNSDGTWTYNGNALTPDIVVSGNTNSSDLIIMNLPNTQLPGYVIGGGNNQPQSGNKDPGFWGCTGQALGQNWKSLAIDGAALALNFAPGGIAAKYGAELFVGGLALGAVGISNSIGGMNPTRMGLNGASLGAGISGMLASVGGPAQTAFPGSSVGAVSKFLGGTLGITSAGIDGYNTYLDYKECRAGKGG